MPFFELRKNEKEYIRATVNTDCRGRKRKKKKMQKERDVEWQFCQVFGEPGEEITEVDIVSAVEFDNTGEFLAAGDRGGRVVIFQRVEVGK